MPMNLFNTWDIVVSITQQLKQLEVLNLSYNRLKYPTVTNELSNAFLKLKVLVLNHCNIQSMSEVQNFH